MKKLNKKERDEVVTKGYLVENGYIKKEEVEKYIDDFITDKKFVTSEILVDVLKHSESETHRYMGSLMEDNHATVRTLIEAFENRFEIIENKLDGIDNRFEIIESKLDLIDRKFGLA